MRRIEMIANAAELLNVLKESGFDPQEAMRIASSEAAEMDKVNQLAYRLAAIALRLQRLPDSLRAFVPEFTFWRLTDPKVLQEAIANPKATLIVGREIAWAHQGLRAFIKMLRDGDRPDLQVNFEKEESFVRFVFDYPQGLCRLDHFAKSMAALHRLALQMSRSLNIPFEEPEIVSLDSGSKLDVTLKFAQAVGAAIKANYTALLERTFFYSQTKGRLDIENVGRALPILVDIEKRVQDGHLNEKIAGVMKAQIISSMTTLVEAKAILPAFEKKQEDHQKLLIATSPKLLAEGASNCEQSG